MANISRITDFLFTGGDLPVHLGTAAMLADLDDYRGEGITHVVDNRMECSDEGFFAKHAPDLVYVHNGQDDRGQRMPDAWFDRGVGAAMEALARSTEAVVLVHCHMGVDRGPSLAYAILLALGWDTLDAMRALRAARPIAAAHYSADALDWWLRFDGAAAAVRRREHRRLAEWHERHPLDVRHVVRRQRELEAAGLPLGA
ncbi:dual specificity protein phosphatase family protein [Cellulomonas marina]|nr:dual specificity protein phosphatase [Cellulomonas marina]